MLIKNGKPALFVSICLSQLLSSRKRFLFGLLSVCISSIILLCGLFLSDSYIRSMYKKQEPFPKKTILVNGEIPAWLQSEIKLIDSKCHSKELIGLSANNSAEYTSKKYSILFMPSIFAIEANAFSTPIPTPRDSSIAEQSMIIKGRDLSTNDIQKKARVAVISDMTARIVFGSESALGNSISLSINSEGDLEVFTIIGIYKENTDFARNLLRNKTETINFPQYIYIPLSICENQESIGLSSKRTVIVGSTQKKTEKIFALLSTNSELPLHSFSSNMKTVYEVSVNLRHLLFIAIFIILLISGVSLLNNLVFSIRERTVEIGIKKAMGAKGIDICLQFFFESMVIGFAGFLLGLIISIFGMLLLQIGILGFLPISLSLFISPKIIAISLFLILLQSTVFNILPAIFTTRIKVADAVRFD